jgi:hypothetical protein
MVYLNNLYGIEVTGEFSVTSFEDSHRGWVTDVMGSGSVDTARMPDLDAPEVVHVGTGKRRMFGLGPERTQPVATGRFEVDDVFRQLIRDYGMAYARILRLLSGGN